MQRVCRLWRVEGAGEDGIDAHARFRRAPRVLADGRLRRLVAGGNRPEMQENDILICCEKNVFPEVLRK